MTTETLLRGLVIDGDQVRDIDTLKNNLIDLAGKDQEEVIKGRLASEIITASMASSQPIEFTSLTDFWENLLFRLGAVASMTALVSGVYDGDYYDPTLGPVPRLGTTDASRVSKYWQFQQPGQEEDADWQQTTGHAAAEAVLPEAGHSLPFRGECAGAFQLTVFWGLLNGLGASKFNDLASQFGTMLVGPWTDNPATDFMAQHASLQDPPIPGDYMYFKNKDDYLKWAPDGFWQGLNSMYVGADMLGTRHYSGMGASWMSEQNLRASLVNAYYHDCYPHTISNPDTEVRFTIRRLLQVPSSFTKAAAMADKSSASSNITIPTVANLQANGFQATSADTLENRRMNLKDCAKLFGFSPEDLHQHNSSGIDNPPMRFRAPGATVTLAYHNAGDHRHDPNAQVHAIVKMKPAT